MEGNFNKHLGSRNNPNIIGKILDIINKNILEDNEPTVPLAD